MGDPSSPGARTSWLQALVLARSPRQLTVGDTKSRVDALYQPSEQGLRSGARPTESWGSELAAVQEMAAISLPLASVRHMSCRPNFGPAKRTWILYKDTTMTNYIESFARPKHGLTILHIDGSSKARAPKALMSLGAPDPAKLVHHKVATLQNAIVTAVLAKQGDPLQTALLSELERD